MTKKKYTILLAFLALLIHPISAQVDEQFSERWERKLNHILETNSANRQDGHNHRACMTSLLIEGKANRERLTLRLQKTLETFEDRPTLAFNVESAHFVVHYDKTGDNAVSSVDNNTNAIPDYIEFMINTFEDVYKMQHETMGYIIPPSDGSEGGNAKYDVYVTRLAQGLYGYVNPETLVGDNPNSTNFNENLASTSWMMMRNNYDNFELGNEGSVQVTVAHEYFHAVQMGYAIDFDFNNPTNFLFEATATWMEDEAYPRLDDNLQYLESVFNNPDVALNANFNDEGDPNFSQYDGQWYGTWIFFRYLSERYGSDVVRTLWEKLRSDLELDALDKVLIAKNTTFQRAFEDYLVANLVLSNASSSAPYTYTRANDYKDYLQENNGISGLKIENTINIVNTEITWNSSSRGNGRLMRLSADYFKLTSNVMRLNFDIENVKSMGLISVSILPNGQVKLQKDFTSNTGSVNLTLTDFDSNNENYLIVYRLDSESSSFSSPSYTFKVTSEELVSGIEDKLDEGEYFLTAPNPIQHQFKLLYQFNASTVSTAYQIEVVDILGRRKIVQQLNEEYISTTNWANGVYFITLLKEGKPVALRKLVVTH